MLTACKAVLVADPDGNEDGRVLVVTAGNVWSCGGPTTKFDCRLRKKSC